MFRSIAKQAMQSSTAKVVFVTTGATVAAATIPKTAGYKPFAQQSVEEQMKTQERMKKVGCTDIRTFYGPTGMPFITCMNYSAPQASSTEPEKVVVRP